jgi:type VI secretion system protein ImpC
LDERENLAQLFEGQEYTRWRSFRSSEDARYVGLTLPHVLVRLPYGPETLPVEAFNYTEEVSDDHQKYLWGRASYALIFPFDAIVQY